MPDSISLLHAPRGQAYSSADGAVTVEAGELVIITDTVLASMTNNQDPNDRYVGPTLPAGTLIVGDVTAFEVTSGLVHHIRP